MGTDILKLERYREDYHGTCARMAGKFGKRFKFSTISSGHAWENTHAILPVGKASRRSLFPGSSYIEPRPGADILCCIQVARRMSKKPVVQYHYKQRLPC